MSFSFKEFGIILILVIISLVVFSILKKYVFHKVKLKKTYVVICLLIILALPFLFYKTFYKMPFLNYAQTILLSILILTYIEVRRNEKVEKNRPIIGRPKSKKRPLK